jgi:hypothetical protein
MPMTMTSIVGFGYGHGFKKVLVGTRLGRKKK